MARARVGGRKGMAHRMHGRAPNTHKLKVCFHAERGAQRDSVASYAVAAAPRDLLCWIWKVPVPQQDPVASTRDDLWFGITQAASAESLCD